ncbi:MAG: indolepyruvate ferredoxin oxidoreductase family protein, partial [Alphaproteobacteria bacterium]|nr:indolepyruvate ferredoxin oxidoreductase family protein [Alphaproteobacteria bacterium]
AFMDAMIPVLNPANVQDILDLGVYGWALSRYAGCWAAMKTIAEIMDSSASVAIDPTRVAINIPADFEMPEGGLNIRWPDAPLDQEYRLHKYKLYAALAFARANNLNRTVIDSPKARFGIATAGKSYLDVMQALEDLGIDAKHAAEIGLRVYKIGMTWPLEREGVRQFAEGLEEILVVEEKRAVIENQLKEQLYNWREDVRPRVIGKFDEKREWILPSNDELTPARIARVIAARIQRFYSSERIQRRLAFLAEKEKALAEPRTEMKRVPYFCSGCPHNTSTKVPEGSRALAGIGCHYMAQWMDRNTATFTQMGGEGVTWVGQAPFTETPHVFANLGDGTYIHSGILAVRQSVAAGVNMTYKLLYNDAVAMTGGQRHDANFDVALITHQLYGEGVKKVVVVSDEPDKYPVGADFAQGVTVHHRDELDTLQRQLREIPGVTAIVYDQTCAAEKRRRRKRGLMVDPPKRAFINDLVCEGCGDCGVKSNCLSVVPLETEFGRKRAIEQSTCNKDMSCVEGFCPSFVTIHGGGLRKPERLPGGAEIEMALPSPAIPSLERPYGILVTGVGGTGVVTIGALIGMAAHLEGKGCAVLDMTGLAQKGGSVVSHIRIAARPEDIHAVRIAAGGARLVLGCDMMVAAGFDGLAKMERGTTRAIINSHETTTGDFTRNPDLQFPGRAMADAIVAAVGKDAASFVDATRLATALLGDSIATNLFMLGFAFQRGLVPVSEEALLRAIELNAVAVDANKRAFRWGRRAAHDLDAVERAAKPVTPIAMAKPDVAASLEEMVERRIRFLTGYQDAAYARRYKDLVVRVQRAEADRAKGMTGLAQAVARNYFKLLAYKDEYEVARLHADPTFAEKLRANFDGDYKVRFHLAPPLISPKDPATGEARKMTFGPWMLNAFRVLAKLKGLRGTPFDIFGRTEERRLERKLIADYEATIDELLSRLSHDNHAAALAIADVPEHIRGYGHVKLRHLRDAKAKEAALLAQFRAPAQPRAAAE